MDGNHTIPVLSLGDIFENAMRQTLPFSTLRRDAYEFLRTRGHSLISVDRIGEEVSMTIVVTYWNAAGETVSEAFDEWPSYTLARPLSTW